jgi:predicted nucleotidyltransferase
MKTLEEYFKETDRWDEKGRMLYSVVQACGLEAVTSLVSKAVLQFLNAKTIYLFGSWAYGSPRIDSDMDILVVAPDNADVSTWKYGEIIGWLADNNIYITDLLLYKESVFNHRKDHYLLEETVYNKGKLIYGH